MRPLLNLGDLLDATEDSLGAAREAYNTSSLENNNSGSTTVVRPLGAHDPSSLRQPTYRHRRPRAHFESPNLNAPSTYRSPHLSHERGEFKIHIGSDSEGSLAKDSDDEAVRSSSEGRGRYELYEEWNKIPYPDELRPTDSSLRQHRSTQRTRSGSPVPAPKPAIPVATVPTSPFTSEDESIEGKRTQQKRKRKGGNDKPTAKSQSQPYARQERHIIRRRLRFLRAQCLALESDLFFMDPGVLNGGILERIESDLDGLLDLVKSIQGGNEQAPGGGKVEKPEKT